MKVQILECIGGASMKDDMLRLKGGAQVIVGTPGRVLDMIQRGYLNVDNLKIFCLDEADEMLSRGFKDQIYEVFKFMPQDVRHMHRYYTILYLRFKSYCYQLPCQRKLLMLLVNS